MGYIGWTKAGDTIVLQSSDIGNQAWEIKNNSFIEVQLDDKLNSRAEELYNLKYK